MVGLRNVGLTLACGLVSAAACWLALGLFGNAGFDQPKGYLAPTAKLLEVAARGQVVTRNFAPFEGGNIGEVRRSSGHAWHLHLRSDNDDALPTSWRQWFYLQLDGLPVGPELSFTLHGAGQSNYYLPFYSYDNINWIQFKPAAVTQLNKTTMQFRGRFDRRRLWLARFVPYHYSRLLHYLGRHKHHPAAVQSSLGTSAQGRTIPVLTIAEGQGQEGSGRPWVVLHARTHPGEVGSSFLLEGFINFLLSKEPVAVMLRRRLVFVVVPMLNVDGVVSGNNRVSPLGVNFEGRWFSAGDSSLALDQSRVPVEVGLFHAYLVRLLRARGAPSVALNLHASAGEPADRVFTFPHFGPSHLGYAPAEAKLFSQQMRFIEALRSVHGPGWFNQPPAQGGRDFLAKQIPERWWWEHFKEGVMALTLESTYGLAAAGQGRWVKPSDMRRLGASLAVAIGHYHALTWPCDVAVATPQKGLDHCR